MNLMLYSTLYELMVSTNIYCSYELCTEITFLIPLANYHRRTLAVSNCLGYVARFQTSSISSIHIPPTAETVGFFFTNWCGPVVSSILPQLIFHYPCHNLSFTVKHSIPISKFASSTCENGHK